MALQHTNQPAPRTAGNAPAAGTAPLMQTLDQQRARHAWQVVETLIKNFRGDDQKDYQREAKKLPVRIMTAGLGQSLAFLAAKQKKKTSLDQLLKGLADWVLVQRKIGSGTHCSLIEAIINDAGGADFLRRATDETLEYLRWLNRFLEAKLGDIEANGDEK